MGRDSPRDAFFLLKRSSEIMDQNEGDCLINHPALFEGYEIDKMGLSCSHGGKPPEGL